MATADQFIHLFNEAKAKPAGAERERFLAEACGTDSQLREQILSLLQAEAEGGNTDFLKRTSPIRQHALVTEQPGDRIGRYKLLQVLGEGGCGVVYMAEQEEPVRRRVALKVIKLGMDTKSVIARFEAERQALALMDHPNIAKVLDAGATETGRPFFVMELVRGIKITEYCDQNNLAMEERLELFTQVCHAVQHAHQKGIIHRDLKPSNILVTLHDGVPVPKVIDFGIAKATSDQRLTDKTIFTAFEQFIGTPAYMSPEQAEMSGLDIDTRSDVYSLGVLLYELLTGRTPLDAHELLHSGIDEMRRKIREEDPPRPSTRLSTMQAADLTTIANHRHADVPKLLHLVRGDLDWIVMKCLEKDRRQRYESASSLGLDIQRHLRNEAVLACPPSPVYRFRKFARRNKAVIVTLALVLSALLLVITALTISTVLIAREQRTTRRALQGETDAKRQLERRISRERVDSYFHRITLAHRELQVDSSGRAAKLLEECPIDLRGWEWRYLRRLSRVEPVSLSLSNAIHSLSFAPSGEQIAIGCGDGTVKVFDHRRRRVIQTLHGHSGYVFSVVFSSTGRHIASAAADRTVRLWSVASGQQAFQWAGHGGDFAGMSYAIAFSPTGKHLAAGGEDGFVIVWDAQDGRERYRLSEKHENTAMSVAFSSDGQRLATGSWAGVVRIWESGTGRLLHKLAGHIRPASAVVFSPDGKLVASASFDRTIKVWKVATGEPLQTARGHSGIITGLAFSHDGRRLFSSGAEDKTVRVWEPLSGREILTLRGQSLGSMALASGPRDSHVASISTDGTIRILDATPLSGDEGPKSLTLHHPHEVWSVMFRRDSQQLASASFDGAVKVWDVQTGTLVQSVRHPEVINPFSVAFSRDGDHLAAAGMAADRTAIVPIWNTKTWRRNSPEIRGSSTPFAAVFDPTGRFLVREGPQHTVEVRDVHSGELAGTVGRHEQQIWAMTFSPDGRRLATASSDRSIRVWGWDLEREQPPQLELRANVGGYCNRVAFSHHGLWLATAGEAHTVKIWDGTTGDALQTLRGHSGEVYAVAFDPTGRCLASAGEDTTVRLWDIRSWTLQHTLRGHTEVINSLSFSSDGLWLASGSRDHTVRVWNMSQWDAPPDSGE